MDTSWIVIGVGAVVILAILITKGMWRSFWPLKWVVLMLINIMVGAFGLYFLNLFGQMINFYIPINLVTAGVVGILGIPGLIVLIVSKMLIGV